MCVYINILHIYICVCVVHILYFMYLVDPFAGPRNRKFMLICAPIRFEGVSSFAPPPS